MTSRAAGKTLWNWSFPLANRKNLGWRLSAFSYVAYVTKFKKYGCKSDMDSTRGLKKKYGGNQPIFSSDLLDDANSPATICKRISRAKIRRAFPQWKAIPYRKRSAKLKVAAFTGKTAKPIQSPFFTKAWATWKPSRFYLALSPLQSLLVHKENRIGKARNRSPIYPIGIDFNILTDCDRSWRFRVCSCWQILYLIQHYCISERQSYR